MIAPRVLVAGIGNIFLGDDGFGVAVVEKLRSRSLPKGVDVIDFGIRGIDLAYALGSYDIAILVDSVSRGGAPGTLYVLQPEPSGGGAAIEMHAMTPDYILSWLDPTSGPRILRILGCEPASFGPDGEGRVGCSPSVLGAVDEAIQIIEDLIPELVRGDAARA
jgi:hydrogenase maturation protease